MFFDFSILVFFAACGIQIVFHILLLVAFLKHKNNYSDQARPVSVVIAAHDEESNLVQLLPKLYTQSHKEFEIIVVDDRSNDGTYDFLLSETKKNSVLKMVTVKQTPDKMNGKKYALTLGIKAAKYENILLTDADCLPESDHWIETMSKNFAVSKVEINLGVSLYSRSKGLLNSFIRFESLLTAVQYIGMALLGFPYMGVGRNLAYKKSLFLNNKGFNSHISTVGGDDDLFVNKHAKAKNTAVQLGVESLVYSTPKNSISSFVTQKIRHLSVGIHYKIGHKLILGLLTLSQFTFWFLTIRLAFELNEPYIVGIGFIVRTVLLYLLFAVACKKFGIRFSLWGLVFLDFIFVFYYLSIGIRTLFTKRVRWS